MDVTNFDTALVRFLKKMHSEKLSGRYEISGAHDSFKVRTDSDYQMGSMVLESAVSDNANLHSLLEMSAPNKCLKPKTVVE